MEYEEEEDTSPSSYNLEDLLEYLRIPDKTPSNVKFDGFQYYNKVLTKSKLPSSVDFFFWMLFYVFLEIIISTTPLQNRIFDHLNPTTFEESTNSAQPLYSKVLAQLFTVFIFVFTIILIIFQLPNPSNNFSMGHLKATFLHLSLVHLPMILTPCYGILFGSEIMSIVGNEANDHSGTYYALLALMSFLSLICSTSIFTSATWNKLTITNHPFEYWEFPYGFIDLIFFFLVGTFFPLGNSHFEKSIIGIMIIQFIYGCYFLLKRRHHSFIYLTPNFIEAKIGIDCIIFSIVAMANLFSKLTSVSKISLIFVTHFLDMIIAAIVVARIKILGTSLLKRRSFTVDRRRITSPSDAITIIRSGLMLSIPSVANIDFIKWIAKNRFSPKLLPDLYRICLVLKKPLKSISIPMAAFGTMDVLSYQFLAFQVESFLEMIDDENPAVKSTVENLNILNEKIELMLNKFWTTEDYDQITIYKLGTNIFNIKMQYDESIFKFPFSEKINDAHKRFALDILKMPNFIPEEHKNPYFYIAYPKKTIYSFLGDKSKSIPLLPTRPKLTANEKTANDMIRRGSKTLIVFFRIMVVLTFFYTLYLWALYYHQINETWDFFINIAKFQQASIALSTSELVATDKLMKFPDSQIIQNLIGLPIESAALFRAPMVLKTSFNDILKTIIYLLPSGRQNNLLINDSTCYPISFASLISTNVADTNENINSSRCYLISFLYHINMIENLCIQKIEEFEQSLSNRYNTLGIVQMIIVVIALIIFTILFCMLRSDHGKLLSAIRLVLSSKPNYHENEYLDFQFWIFPTLAILLFSLAGTIGFFLSYVYASTSNDDYVKRIINETVSISHIIAGLEKGMILTEFSILDKKYQKQYEDLVYIELENVYNSVNNLTINHFSSSFLHIDPIYKWCSDDGVSYSTILLDVCRFLKQRNHSEESFDFLAARAYFIYNVSILISDTLPQMYESAHYSMLNTPSKFWWISMTLLLLTILLHLIYARLFYKRMRKWFKAALIILLRNSTGDLKNLIERKKVSLPDLAPFPILIKNKKTNIIMYANPATTKYTDLSIGQLIGQELNNVWKIDNNNTFTVNDRKVVITETFIENNDTFSHASNSINESESNNLSFQNIDISEIESESEQDNKDSSSTGTIRYTRNSSSTTNDNRNNNNHTNYTNNRNIDDYNDNDDKDLSMILFNDITEIGEFEEKCKNLIRQTRISNVSLPFEDDMFAMEIRIDADVVNTENIFKLYKSCEKKSHSMIRIACGPSFYTGFAQANTDPKYIIKFIYEFMKEINEIPPPQNQSSKSAPRFGNDKNYPFGSFNQITLPKSNPFPNFSLPSSVELKCPQPQPPIYTPPLNNNLNGQPNSLSFAKTTNSDFDFSLNLNNYNNNNNQNSNNNSNQNSNANQNNFHYQNQISEPPKNEIQPEEEHKDANFSHIIISVVHSPGKVISLCGNNSVALLCGKAAKRAHDCVLNGYWGKVYIDFDLIQNFDFDDKYSDLEDKIIQIADSSPKDKD